VGPHPPKGSREWPRLGRLVIGAFAAVLAGILLFLAFWAILYGGAELGLWKIEDR
jgi:hypothetical protein